MGKTEKQSARHTVRSKKPLNRAKLSRTKRRPHIISIFAKLNRKSENVSKFADFLLKTGNDDDDELYQKLVTYIAEINSDLEDKINMFKGMYKHTHTRRKTNKSDTFETLVNLSRRVTKFGNILLKQSKKQQMLTAILKGLVRSVETIYDKLKYDLESFEGELELAAQIEREEAERQAQAAAMAQAAPMNEESGTNNNANKGPAPNDDGLGGLLTAFRGLGLGK